MYFQRPLDVKLCKFEPEDVLGFYKRLHGKSKYSYEADFNCVDMSLLEDKVCTQGIAEYFDIDFDSAEKLMRGHAEDLEDILCNDEDDLSKSWDARLFLEEVRGACGVKMGYDGCIKSNCYSEDLYIVPIFGRKNELRRIK